MTACHVVPPSSVLHSRPAITASHRVVSSAAKGTGAPAVTAGTGSGVERVQVLPESRLVRTWTPPVAVPEMATGSRRVPPASVGRPSVSEVAPRFGGAGTATARHVRPPSEVW